MYRLLKLVKSAKWRGKNVDSGKRLSKNFFPSGKKRFGCGASKHQYSTDVIILEHIQISHN